MVDKEINVRIKAQTETQEFDDMKKSIEELINKENLVKIDYDTSGLDSIKNEVDDVKESVDDVNNTPVTPEGDNTGVESVKETLNEVKDSEDEVNNTTVSPSSDTGEVENINDSLENVKGNIDEVNNTPVALPADSSSIDDLNNKLDETKEKGKEAGNGLGEAISAIAGAGVVAGMEEMFDVAGNISDSWNRLKLTFDNVSNELKSSVNRVADATGRAGSKVRKYFNDMGRAGINDLKLIEDSYKSLSGATYRSGADIESNMKKIYNIVNSGSLMPRSLNDLGTNLDRVARVMGVTRGEASKLFKTLSMEDRLKVLTEAMGDGTEANEMYKNSWAGLNDKLNAVKDGFIGLVGSVILPFVMPVMDALIHTIESLTDWFNSLDDSTKSLIGFIGTLTFVFAGLFTVISGFMALKKAVAWLEVLPLLTNPYVALALVIVGLGLALYYLYQNCKPVHTAFDHVGEALGRLCEALDVVTPKFEGLLQVLGVNGGDLFYGLIFFLVAFSEGLVGIIGKIVEFIGWCDQLSAYMNAMFGLTGSSAMNWGALMLTPLGWVILGLANLIGIAQHAGLQIVASFFSMLFQAQAIFGTFRTVILGFGQFIVASLVASAINAVRGFSQQISRLPQVLWDEFQRMLGMVDEWAWQMVEKIFNVGSQMWQALMRGLGKGSPGKMYYMVVDEFSRINDYVSNSDTPSFFYDVGSRMVEAFNKVTDLNMVSTPNIDYIPVNTSSDSNISHNATKVEINNVFNLYGDVDSDARMNKIVDLIIERMTWDNNTAGRTV